MLSAMREAVRSSESKPANIELSIGINSGANLLTVERSTGEQAKYDPRRLTGVSVYREVALEFAVGDRIQFTTPDKSLGIANRDLAIVESVAADGLDYCPLRQQPRH